MKLKALSSLAAGLVVATLAQSAVAATLGDHPAVLVAKTWKERGIDPNTFIVLHPAGPIYLAASPSEKEKTPREKSRVANVK